jgi:hypothetical protein
MPTGWRPDDVALYFPQSTIKNVYDFKRYNPPSSNWLKGYALFQFIAILALLLYMFYYFGSFRPVENLVAGGYIFISIYGYTSLMDRRRYALWIEMCRAIFLIITMQYLKDTLFIEMLPGSVWSVMLYAMITLSGSICVGFCESLFQKTSQSSMPIS